MSGEKYPAKLVEKVARRLRAELAYADQVPETWDRDAAVAILDAIPYAAMREALKGIEDFAQGMVEISNNEMQRGAAGQGAALAASLARWQAVGAALRAADGEEATNEQRDP